MTIEEFCGLNAEERDLVLRYISVHTLYPYAALKHISDCLLGYVIYLVPPLSFFVFRLLLAEVPEDYADDFS